MGTTCLNQILTRNTFLLQKMYFLQDFITFHFRTPPLPPSHQSMGTRVSTLFSPLNHLYTCIWHISDLFYTFIGEELPLLNHFLKIISYINKYKYIHVHVVPNTAQRHVNNNKLYKHVKSMKQFYSGLYLDLTFPQTRALCRWVDLKNDFCQ